MITRDITIINKLGLHARAAAKLINVSSSYESEIHLIRDEQRVNGKSIMGVMMLAAAKGVEITLEADGKDEEDAIAALVTLINNRFGEDE